MCIAYVPKDPRAIQIVNLTDVAFKLVQQCID